MAHRAAVALLVMLMASASISMIHAADPELTVDFYLPPGVNASGDFFTSKLLQGPPALTSDKFATVTLASLDTNFTALQGLGVAAALIQYPPGTVNRPHIHPRATELLFVIKGTLYAGFVDSTNKLFAQTLSAGELFVFPRGLVHFQTNLDAKEDAIALGSFSSSNPGRTVLPLNLFGTGIDQNILAKSFQVSVDTIRMLVAANPLTLCVLTRRIQLRPGSGHQIVH